MDEAELAFVATMRDEASAVARSARKTIESTTGKTKPIDTELRLDAEGAMRLLDELPKNAKGTVNQTSEQFRKLSPDVRAAVMQAQAEASSALAKIPPEARAQGQKTGERLTEGIKSSTAGLKAQLRTDGEQGGRGLGEGIADGLSGAKGAVAGAVAALGVGALLNDAIGREFETDKLGATLAATPKLAERYGRIASDLYAGAWGESMQDVSNTVESVVSSFPRMTEGELRKASEHASAFATGFEVDVTRAANTAGIAVQSGLAKNAVEAFDLMTAASQQVPKHLREDVLDAVDEYAQFFNSLGYDGEQAFSVLAAGAEKGMYGIDKAGDAVKEFTIRATDMSTSSQDAYKRIGLDARTMADEILAGGKRARKGTDQVIEGLLAIESPSERANTAIALFGTPIEDLNVRDIPAFLRSLQSTDGKLGQVAGSADRLGAALGDNASTKLTEFQRQAKTLAVDVLATKVIPVIERLAEAFNNAPEPVQQTVTAVGLLVAIGGPLMMLLGGIGRGVTGAVSGIATLAGGFATARTHVSTYAAQLRSAETRQVALARGAKLAAGAAGIGALIASTKSENEALGILGSAAAGALTGSVAGPWGAAVGGVLGGAMGALKARTDDTAESLRQAAPPAKDFAASLDQVSGAATTTTRELAYLHLQETGAIEAAGRMGVAQRDLVGYLMGNENAIRRVNRAIAESGPQTQYYRDQFGNLRTVTTGMSRDALTLQTQLGKTGGALKGATAEVKAKANATAELGELYKGLPKRVLTKIDQIGQTDSIKRIRKLQADYKLTPKKLETVIRALNVDASEKQIRRIKAAVLDTSKTKGGVPEFAKGVAADAGKAVRAGDKGAKDTKRAIEQPLRGARANLDQWKNSITSGASAPAGPGRSGAEYVGSQMKAGLVGGMYGAGAALSAVMSSAVRQAITAARNAAKVKSPSRLTLWLGQMIGRGLELGLDRSTRHLPSQAEKLISSIMAGLNPAGGEAAISAAFDRIEARVEQHYKTQMRAAAKARLKAINVREDRRLAGTDNKRAEARIRKQADKAREKAKDALSSVDDRAAKATAEVAKSLRAQRNALVANGRQLDTYRQRLADATAQGVSFADSLKAYGALGQTQTVNDAPITAGFIEQDLTARLAEISAFRKNLQTLRQRGVNEAYVDQLEAAGVAAGGATAAAMAVATDEQLRNISNLQKQIGAQADAAGRESVAGMVAGINSQIAKLEKAGAAMARALRKAIRAALKIKSPSRLTRADGREIPAGMTLGILDGVNEAERAARELSRTVAAAVVPSIPPVPVSYAPSVSQLSAMADAVATSTLAVQTSQVVTIRHEVVSPDGSISDLTASEVADLIARDPRSAKRIETALRAARGRKAATLISASDS